MSELPKFLPKTMLAYDSSEIDWHERVSGDKKVVQAKNDLQILHDMAVPCDEPAEAEDDSQFGPEDTYT